MAGFINDALSFKPIDSSEAKNTDLPQLEVAEKAQKQTKELVEAINGISKVSDWKPGLLGVVNEQDLHDALMNDYLGRKESAINITFDRDPISNTINLAKIDITPEKMDKLIKVINDSTAEGNAFKQSLLKASGAKSMDFNDKAQVELTIRHKLKDGIAEINR